MWDPVSFCRADQTEEIITIRCFNVFDIRAGKLPFFFSLLSRTDKSVLDFIDFNNYRKRKMQRLIRFD